jgi:hypothetical protein
MASIKEVIEDVKDSVGDNGFMWIIVGIGALFVISLLKDSGTGTTYTAPTSYASYPDAVTNANVIIDTLQNNIEYSEQNIKEYIDDGLTETNANINSQFEYINDYMNEGFAKQEELSNKIYDSTMNGFGEIKEQIVDVNTNISNVGSSVSGAMSSLQSQLDNVSSTVSKIDKTTTATNTTTNAIKKATSTSSKASTSTNVGTTKTATKTIKTSYTGNSIVDGLKSAGVNSSYAYREQLAKANGITNYTGSASQNTALLDKLKKGTLKSA